MKNLLLIIVSLILVSPCLATTQQSRVLEKYIPATTFSVKNGLPSNNVQAIIQDEDGFIWLATAKGLSRFDSAEFINFSKDKSDKMSLPDTLVENLIIMPENKLWMTINEVGVSIFDQFSNQSINSKNTKSQLFQLPNNNIFGIAKDKNNNIWLSLYGEGIYKWNIKKQIFTKYLMTDKDAWLHSKKTFEIFIDSKNRLWICTIDSLVYRYDIATGKSEEYSFMLEKGDALSSPIYGFAESKNGEVYAAGYPGVFKYNENKHKFDVVVSEARLKENYKGKHTSVRRILLDSKDNLWIGTVTSLLLYSDHKLENVNFFENDEIHNSEWKIHSMIEGYDGNIWIGTEGQGLIKLSPDWDRFNVYLSPHREPIDMRRGYVFNKTIWIIHPSSKMDVFELKQNQLIYKRSLNPDLGAGSIRIDSIYQENEEYIWLSSIHGIHKVNTQTGESVMVVNESGEKLGSVRQFIKAKDGNYYFNQFSENTFAYFNEDEMVAHLIENTPENHFKGKALFQIAKGLDGDLWLASSFGIESLNPETRKFGVVYQSPNDLPVYDYYFDNQDVWVIEDGGLFQFHLDGKKLTPMKSNYTSILPLLNFNKIVSKKGDILVITSEDSGLVELNIKTRDYKVFTTENGLPSNVIVDVLFPKDKPILVTESGIALYNDNFVIKNSVKPKLVFDKIELNDKKLKYGDANTVLNYDYKTLMFDLALLSYTNAETVEYMYKLEGLNDNWINTGNDDKYSFLKLYAGDYTLKVKGRNNYDKWSDIKQFSFKVNPPPWKTWWAYSLYVFALTAFVFWILYLYKRKLLYENEIKQQQVKRDLANAASKAKSDFLARVSHEVRTPLNGVLGMSELLQDTNLDEEQLIYSESIIASGKHLLDIINDILDLSKIEAGKLDLASDPLDLLLLTDEIVASFTSQVKQKNILFSCYYDHHVKRLRVGDSIRIKQILFNLLSNAFKFTQEGEVVLSVVETPDSTKNSIDLIVKDSGIGIPQKALGELFHPFIQADSAVTRKFGGTGLGLAIVKQLTEKMNGSVSVTSKEGTRSIFTATIEVECQDKKDPDKSNVPSKISLITQNKSLKDSLHQYLLIMGVEVVDVLSFECKTVVVDSQTALKPSQRKALEAYDKVILIDLKHNSPNELTSVDASIKTLSQRAKIISQLTLPITYKKLSDALLGNLTTVMISDNTNKIKIKPLKILMVEDNSINQHISIEMLEKLNHQVDILDNAEEALIHLERNTYDLVFIDYHLPEMDGLTLISQWQNEKNIPIVIITADLSTEVLTKCKESNICHIVGKPFNFQQLSDTIHRAVNQDN